MNKVRLPGPQIDMAKVTAAVAALSPSPLIRRPNLYHDLPPVDSKRRRQVANLRTDQCRGFEDPNFLH